MKYVKGAGLALAFTGMCGTAQALDVTPDVIFGDGNDNGAFTIATGTYQKVTTDDIGNIISTTDIGVEIGLRAKLRFDDSNQPQNIFNYDGVETYTFEARAPLNGFNDAPDPADPGTAIWNFEWSVNTDVNNLTPTAGMTSLSALTYQIRLDGDPTADTNFLVFDPVLGVNGFTLGNAIGDNTTGNGDGAVATPDDPLDMASVAAAFGEYESLLTTNQVAQNSGNYEFFNFPGTALAGFIGANPGQYRIEFEAFFDGQSVASTGINVNSVAPIPLPAGLPLLATAIAAFGLLRLRQKA